MFEFDDENSYFKGVLEGFYGRTWTHVERKNMIEWMGTQGFNAYLYAPKDDSYHREKWREPYPSEDLEQFKELNEMATDNQVAFIIGLSPGLSLTYSDPNELDAIWRKINRFSKLGIRTFGLFYDDIPFELQHEADRKKYDSLAHAQVDFTNKLYQRGINEGIRLIVCPTHYSGEPEGDYLNTLGSLLDKNIELFWAGPEICSKSISKMHLDKVSKIMRRPPILWDNYPVNDLHMTPELHIGPYSGRDSSLRERANGVFLNAMNQPYASQIPLGCAAEFFNHPESYDPDLAWEKVIKQFFEGSNDRTVPDAFIRFSQAVSITPLNPEEPPYFNEFVDKWKKLIFEDCYEEAYFHALNQSQEMMKTVYVLKQAMINNEVLQDMAPWIEDYGKWGHAIEMGARLMGERHGYKVVKDEEKRLEYQKKLSKTWTDLAEMLSESVKWPTRTCGDVLRTFMQHLLRSMSHMLLVNS